jgi:hypothetical protein
LIEATRKERRHADGLARAVRGEDRELVAERSRRFLEAFVRPRGLDQPATPVMIDQLEQLAETSLPPAERTPGPPNEQLQAAIKTLEPIFRLPTDEGRRTPVAKELDPSSGEKAGQEQPRSRKRRARRHDVKRAGTGQRRARRRSRRGDADT